MGSHSSIIMPGSLFRENSSQRFRRESLEIWEKVKTEETHIRKASVKETVTKDIIDELRDDVNEEDNKNELKLKEIPTTISKTEEGTKNNEVIFPKRLKSKFAPGKPALWEQNMLNLKNKNMK